MEYEMILTVLRYIGYTIGTFCFGFTAFVLIMTFTDQHAERGGFVDFMQFIYFAIAAGIGAMAPLILYLATVGIAKMLKEY